MADKNTGMFGQIGTADRYILPLDGAGAGGLAVQFRSNSFVGTGLVLECRVGSDGTNPWLPCPYVKVNVGGTASDGTVASTAVAGNGVIQVPVADGLQFALNNTVGYTSGTMDYWTRMSQT